MKRFKFGNTKVYVVPGTQHRFRTEHDAKYYCEQNNIDFATVEKYDSKKEYDRWLELQMLEKGGAISDLQRQVEYEIIPAHYETIHMRDKNVKKWLVYTSVHDGIVFDTKKAATEYCKEKGYHTMRITPHSYVEPVYKQVCIEKNAVYTADFVYIENGQLVVEDVKSDITRKEADYVLRRKLMLHVHGIRIKET